MQKFCANSSIYGAGDTEKMSKQISIKLEPISENKDKTVPSHSLKSLAIVAAAFKRRPNNSTRAFTKCSSKQLSLELYLYEDTVPVITLVTEGRLEELKSAINEHNLTLTEVDENGQTLLHHAVLHNQELIMSFLIDNGCNVDAVDNRGNTPLHLAADNDLPEACHLLLTNGANDSILNKDAFAPLHLAARGKNKSLSAILDHPINTSVQGHRGMTVVHIICEHDNIEGMDIIQTKVTTDLLKTKKTGFKLLVPDDNGLTPIHLAARKNSYRVLDYIIRSAIEFGHDIDLVFGFLDEDNSTPLHAAVDSCNTEVVEVLLKHGASPVDSKGDLIPPLHLACSQGRSDMVKMMVEHVGPQIISSTDQQQKTPLHHCALSIYSSFMIPFLIENGKGIIQIDAHDARGRTPLHNAITSANLAGFKELISYGASPLAKDQEGLNALHLALNSKRKVVVNALLELSCAPELISQTCNKGYSAIHQALHVGHSEVIPKMFAALRHASDVQKMEDEEGNNYLHIAAIKGDVKALKALLNVLEIHQLLNEPNNCGMTPLHSAATGGHFRCIDLLLNNGAMFHKALNGETAFMIACKKGFTSCATLLLQSQPSQIAVTDEHGNTALHAAAISKTPSLISLLLDKKCKLDANFESLSFFDMIIDSGDLDCVLAVINHDRWQECLDFFSPSCPSPFIRLIEQMPKAAKAVLDRCHSRATLDKSHPDYWESFEFKYLYSQKSNESQNSKESKIHGSLLSLDSNSVYSNSVHSEKEDVTEATVKYKGNGLSNLPQDQSQICVKEVNFGQKTMKILQKMKQFRRQALLTHPVVNAFLESKWRRYGSIYYFTVYAFQVLMVVLLSTFVVLAPHPLKQLSTVNETDPNSTENGDYVLNLTLGLRVIRGVTTCLNSVYMILIIFNVVVQIKRKNGIGPFLQPTVWINVLSVIFMYTFLLFISWASVWPFGGVSCFLSWLSLLLLLENLSLPGTIVKMLLEVTKTVLLVLFVSTFLLLAFAFSFYILAGNISEFDNIGYSFLSVFGFMLGELPYDTYIGLDVAGNLSFGTTVLVFTMFSGILLSIVLANLLIGLAVGDIERVKLNAILQRKDIEIEYFAQLDASIPRGSLKRFSLLSHTIYPNRNRSIWSIWRDSWKWIEYQIEPEQSDTTSSANIAACISDIADLKLHVLELKETLQLMQETNAELRRYHGLSARSSLRSLDFNASEELTDNWR